MTIATQFTPLRMREMAMLNQRLYLDTIEATLDVNQEEILAKIKQRADYLATVSETDSLSPENRATFRELLALCGPLAFQAAQDGRSSFSDWLKDRSFPLRYSRSFVRSFQGVHLRMVLSRWLRQMHHIEWASKKSALMSKLRGSCKKTAWRAAVVEIKNKHRLIAKTIETNQPSDRNVPQVRLNTMPIPIPYKIFRKSFETLPEIRKTLLGNHFSHFSIHEQDRLWKWLMTRCGVVCAREPRYSNMTYGEVALTLRKLGAKRVEDVPSKLYERLWRQGWFDKLRNDGFFAQYLVSAYESTHRSLYELVAANYLFEIQAHKYVNVSFDQPYPKEFTKQIGHLHIKSDILITHPFNQVHIELAMYGTSILKNDLKLTGMETKYREMMAKKAQLGETLKIYDGLHTKFFEVPISLRCTETGKNKMVGLFDFLHNFVDILATVGPLKDLQVAMIDEAFIARLKKNYGDLIKEREDAIDYICIYFAKQGMRCVPHDPGWHLPVFDHLLPHASEQWVVGNYLSGAPITDEERQMCDRQSNEGTHATAAADNCHEIALGARCAALWSAPHKAEVKSSAIADWRWFSEISVSATFCDVCFTPHSSLYSRITSLALVGHEPTMAIGGFMAFYLMKGSSAVFDSSSLNITTNSSPPKRAMVSISRISAGSSVIFIVSYNAFTEQISTY